MNTFAIRALFILGTAAALFLTGWMWGSNHKDREWQAKAAQQQIDAQNAVIEQADRFATIDRDRTAQLRKQQDEIENLRARVAAGTTRLRVSAHCPVPEPVDGAGVGDGKPRGPDTVTGPTGDAYLDPKSEPAYFALRDGLIRQGEQLRACQGIIASLDNRQ